MVVNDYHEMSKKAANMVASQVVLKPDSIIGLATGETPLGMYDELVKMYNAGIVDFNEVSTFNLDEYCGISKDNPQSYHYYMTKNLFSHVNISSNRINIPDGMAEDIEKECIEYDKKIKNAGEIDIQILGIGRNGHIGFNEPDIKFESKTHLVNLDEDTIIANSRFFDSIDEVPTKAISMGIKNIMHAKKIVLLANGIEKASAIYKTIKGKITPEVPASILQLHRDVVIMVNKEAASMIGDNIYED
jgi:glucosamine-6-phosphate deaminase